MADDPRIQALTQQYLTADTPAKQAAALAQLQALQNAPTAAAPVAAPPPSLQAVAAATGGKVVPLPAAGVTTIPEHIRRGGTDEPLVVDPKGAGLVPQSSIDTKVAMPAAASVLGPAAARAAPLKPITLRNTTVTKQIIPGQYTPEDVQRFEQVGQERIERIGDRTEGRLAAIDRSRNVLMQQMELQRSMNEQSGKRASASFKQHEKVTKELQQMHVDLRNSKVDPNHLWDSMTTGRKVMMMLSVAIGGFLEGYTSGKIKNAGLKMLDKAIDRDIAAQRSNFQQKLQLAQLTSSQKNALWQQWRANEGDLKAGMLRLAQLQFSEAKLDSDSEEYRARADDMIMGVKEKLVEIRAKGRDRVRKTVTSSSRQVMPKPAAGATAPAKAKSEFRTKLDALDQLARLRTSYSKHKPNVVSGALGGQETARYAADLVRASATYIKATSGAAVSDEERKNLMKSFATGLGLKERSLAQGLYKIDGHIGDVARQMANMVRANPGLVRQMSPQQRALFSQHIGGRRKPGVQIKGLEKQR